MDVPEVQYARAGDGHRLAWQQWGSGPDVFVVPPLISNCELIWEQELYRRGLEYQGDHVRVTFHPGLRAAVEFDPDLHATLEKFGRLIEEWGADPQWFVDWFNPSGGRADSSD